MCIRTAAEWPVKFTLRLPNRKIVDACVPQPHQTMVIKLPVLIAVGAEPIPGVIATFVSEANGDAVARERPELLNQAVIQFL